MTRRLREAARAKPAPPAIAPALIVFAVAAVVLAWLSARVGDWAVMTDELLYERLAISVSDGVLPRLHGEVTGALALLYPVLIAPVFLFVELPEAIPVVHGVNGVLFASASVPAFLLAREVGVSRFAAVATAVFSVAVPWTVIGAFVMTEAAAYPAALWAMLAIQRAVVEPSVVRDVVAIAAIGAASLARPQLVALGGVLVLAAAAQEARFGRWREHVVAFAVAAVGLVVVLLGGAALLGSYAPALEDGSIVSWEAIRSAVLHVDVTAVALGVVPLLLGLGWAVGALIRPPEPHRLAFGALVTSAVVLLALESGSVVVRFGLGEDVKDRYFFYVVPLLFLATACALEDPRPRVAGLLGVTAFFVLTVGFEEFGPVFGVNVDSPASSTHEALTRFGNESGMSPAEWIAVAGGVLALVLFFALRRIPRAPLEYAVLGACLAFVAAESVYTWDRLLGSSTPSGRAVDAAPTADRSWVDAARPRGDVGMLAFSVSQEWFRSAVAWWDVEFWNASVSRAYRVGPYFTYTPAPFPQPRVTVDPRTGLISGDEEIEYVVRTTLDVRFRHAGIAAATAPNMELVDLEVPHRAAWLGIGLDPDGWTRVERRAVLRVFPPGGLTTVVAFVSAPDVETPMRVTVGPATFELASNEEREISVGVCVPEGGFVDIPITVEGSASVRAIPTTPPFSERFREVGVRLSRIVASATASPCQT